MLRRDLTFTRTGEVGPPVVLLHGFGADRLSWFLVVPEIATKTVVYTVDLPGHGADPAAIGEGTAGGMSQQVADLLEREGIGPATVVGHSLGGAVAIELASRRPDLVSALALIAPAGLGAGIDPAFLADFVAIQDPDQAMAVLRRLVEEPRRISRQMAAAVLRQLDLPRTRDQLRAIARGLHDIDATLAPALQRMAEIEITKTVIWGRRDRINPFDQERAAIPGGKVVLFDTVGHCPHLERSAPEVGGIIREMAAGGS